MSAHKPDWSDWGLDHPEEDAGCTCGYNGTFAECVESRTNQDDRGEAEAMYPIDGGDPSIIIALRSAYRAGVAREGIAALTAGQEEQS